MPLIPGIMAHLRHYKAAREDLQNEAKRKDRQGELDFGPGMNLADADMIRQTMKQFNVTIPEMPRVPRTPLDLGGPTKMVDNNNRRGG